MGLLMSGTTRAFFSPGYYDVVQPSEAGAFDISSPKIEDATPQPTKDTGGTRQDAGGRPAADGGGTLKPEGGVVETLPEYPGVRTFGRAYHFFGDDRTQGAEPGISRKLAGTAHAGEERAYLEENADGSTNPDSTQVHLFLEGGEAECKIASPGPFMHTISGALRLLDVHSDGAYQVLQKVKADSGE